MKDYPIAIPFKHNILGFKHCIYIIICDFSRINIELQFKSHNCQINR